MAWNRIQCMVIKPQKVVFDYDFHIHVFNISPSSFGGFITN